MIADLEGPSFISRTVEHRRDSRRRARDTRPETELTASAHRGRGSLALLLSSPDLITN
jgi:hypothetical protein